MCFSHMARKPGGGKFRAGKALCGVLDPDYFHHLFHLQLSGPVARNNMADPSSALMHACSLPEEVRMAHFFCVRALSEVLHTTSFWPAFTPWPYPKGSCEM